MSTNCVKMTEMSVFNSNKKTVLSGVRPSNRLHIGNYLGSIKGMVLLQNSAEYNNFFMVADLHAMTTPFDKNRLAEDTLNIVLDYLACGIDPSKSIIFIQSYIPEHIELAYYFSTLLSVARMRHLPTYKEKVKENPGHITMALLYYPVLMAADILAYKADFVPAGKDQEPHLEVAREVAKKMNSIYGTHFPEPVMFKTKGAYVPSLKGYGKMSKSVEGSYIGLCDDIDTIKKKLAGVPTDIGRGDSIPKEGGVAALLTLVALFEGKEKRLYYERQYLSGGIRYSDLKDELAESIFAVLKPIQKRRKEFESDLPGVFKIIKEGTENARAIASVTLSEVRGKVGIIKI